MLDHEQRDVAGIPMNLDLFSRSPSGRLIKVGPAEAAYWAFVPNPLPPALELDLSLVKALSAADRALGELAGLGILQKMDERQRNQQFMASRIIEIVQRP
jgi:hypothetical protein